MRFIGVAGRADVEDHEGFIDAFAVGAFPHVADDGTIWQHYRVTTQPAFAFIDDDGSVETHVGALGESELTARLESLLAT